MTHDCCLTDRAVWCWLTQIMTHHRASLVTDPASWPLEAAIRASISHYHMSMSHIANRLHDDRQNDGDCEMSGWYQQTVDVHCGLHRCCYRQNFYRQTTVEFIRYDLCWFKTWCTGIFLWWQKFYIGIKVWDVQWGTVWENMVSVDFKHGACGYFYGENLSCQ